MTAPHSPSDDAGPGAADHARPTAATSLPATDRIGLRHRVDKSLAWFLADRRAWMAGVDSALAPVADAIEGFVLRGGKRLRPAFGYWGFRGAGGHDSDQVVTALAALELVQASALIHDDLIDRSDTRRGEPAVHRRFAVSHRAQGWAGDADGFGESAAVLLGDLCLVWSDELLHAGGLDPAAISRARPVFDEMRTEVTIGQYLDVLTQATGDTSVERAGKVARLKSAKYTVERPLLLGAALADAPAPVAAAYSGYGLPLGEAFQLRDDLLGVFGDPALTGKPAGDDLREGKRTYLVAAAFESATESGRGDLLRLLGSPELDAAGIERLREVIVGSGAAERTERRITVLLESALSAIEAAPIEGEARTALIDLAHAATTRTD
ncbi:geranylgeranyl pyrophosphate synthase [Asanoa siamensis]|uniref:Geranylgeranyl pyrophosphate synthase n=2 Tax=Asanoa siamensis TaxID=926357 RepID=A0ABQ4CZV0_9ACTN|nr:geranylgeranyl pyrophosphate synthase [Asanoa siamensis]